MKSINFGIALMMLLITVASASAYVDNVTETSFLPQDWVGVMDATYAGETIVVAGVESSNGEFTQAYTCAKDGTNCTVRTITTSASYPQLTAANDGNILLAFKFTGGEIVLGDCSTDWVCAMSPINHFADADRVNLDILELANGDVAVATGKLFNSGGGLYVCDRDLIGGAPQTCSYVNYVNDISGTEDYERPRMALLNNGNIVIAFRGLETGTRLWFTICDPSTMTCDNPVNLGYLQGAGGGHYFHNVAALQDGGFVIARDQVATILCDSTGTSCATTTLVSNMEGYTQLDVTQNNEGDIIVSYNDADLSRGGLTICDSDSLNCVSGDYTTRQVYFLGQSTLLKVDEDIVMVHQQANPLPRTVFLSFLPFNTASCIANWTCTGYETCVSPAPTASCSNVSDGNNCSEAYAGNYSEFTPATCSYSSSRGGSNIWPDEEPVEVTGAEVGVPSPSCSIFGWECPEFLQKLLAWFEGLGWRTEW